MPPKTMVLVAADKKHAMTLDAKHTEMMQQFAHDEAAQLSNGDSDRIHAKKLNYYLDNATHIFDYFEAKKNLASANAEETAGGNRKVNAFFKLDADASDAYAHTDKSTEINALVQRYMSNVDSSLIDMSSFVHPTDVCPRCHKGELVSLDDEGVLMCTSCFRNTPYLIDGEKPAYKEPPKEICYYAYKRINHFKEIIAQIQGKETTLIPDEVIAGVKRQIKKERLTLEDITTPKTKEILKKLNFNTYYEHIPFIKDKLGIPPPVMSQELEETLYNLFIDLQAPYSRVCPDDRTNFLGYYYTAYKLCELLDERQYLQYLTLLKDQEKLNDQDATWRKMCEYLDWEFIPTVDAMFTQHDWREYWGSLAQNGAP